MTRPCLNSGGPASRVLLPHVPELEQPISVSDDNRQALEAWQARPGEILSVVDPEGGTWRARLKQQESELFLIPFEEMASSPESSFQLHLFQAIPQRERFELILEKATELGVKRIIPFESRHSISLEERDARQKKSHRWPDVVLRAGRQCRRLELPELAPVVDWDAALYEATHADLKLILYEGECQWHLRELLENEKPHRVALMVGPEGGFSREEIGEAKDFGFLPVSLGSRLLRTETAALATVALVQAKFGDLG